jgi:hypothetical protein
VLAFPSAWGRNGVGIITFTLISSPPPHLDRPADLSALSVLYFLQLIYFLELLLIILSPVVAQPP